MVEIVRIPALSDNYIWLMHDRASGETVVIDPAVAEPVLDAARERGWRISQIWNTHWHPDHTGGNAAVKEATGCTITGPAAEAARIPTLDRLVAEGGTASLGAIEAKVLEVPAHTAGHIAYHLPSESLVFVGDTLFAMGCGRLFEGNAEQMHDNLQRLALLPPRPWSTAPTNIRSRTRASPSRSSRRMRPSPRAWPRSRLPERPARRPSPPASARKERPIPSCAQAPPPSWRSAGSPRTISEADAQSHAFAR
jgi:glyoxylase-like metal-dependent hydrolase (beta-lactamase superfamily II)